MLETTLFLPVVQVVSCFYNDFLACGGRSVTMCFSRKELKGRKEIENQRLRPTIFPEKPSLLV